MKAAASTWMSACPSANSRSLKFTEGLGLHRCSKIVPAIPRALEPLLAGILVDEFDPPVRRVTAFRDGSRTISVPNVPNLKKAKIAYL
jgi:hypothetical protein